MLVITDEAANLNPVGGVTVVQRWQGFPRRKHGLVVTVDDRVVVEHLGTAGQVSNWYRRYTSEMGIGALTLEQARQMLAKAGITPRRCAHGPCSEILPIGGRWCTKCGRPQLAVGPAGARS